MNATRKVKLKDIKVNLTCKLCLGYLIDATTIIECLHSFCKSCIINYLEKSSREEKYCPVCDVQLHSTKPLTSIRSDLMLQEIVYKLVPGLFKNEMRRRLDFYNNNGDAVPTNPLDSGQVFDELYITSDDLIHLSLEYVTDDESLRESTKRYLKCPAAVCIFVLKKLLHGKYDLDADTEIDIMFGERILPDDFLLMDVAYKYSWTKHGNKPLSLRYRIRGHSKPIMKHEKAINDTISAATASPQKETIKEKEDAQLCQTTIKKVCNENGSNIMPPNVPKPIKVTSTGRGTEDSAIAPIRTPHLKPRGRKRKHLNYSNIIIESKADIKKLKRLKPAEKSQAKKLQSDSSVNAQTQMEIIPIGDKNDCKDAKEVQLCISENGVVSVRSISSCNVDQTVIDLNKGMSSSMTSTNTSPMVAQDVNPTEKLLLSGNFYSKTGPSGVTEIICNKREPSSSITPTAKPGYVTLNIPTPKNPMSSSVTHVQNGNGNHATTTKKPELEDKSRSSPLGKINERIPSNKFDVLEKIRNRIATNAIDGDKRKPIPGLKKMGYGFSNDEQASTVNTDRPRPSGMHSLPIIAPLSSPVHQHRLKNLNGGSSVSYPLKLSPTLGMSVSVISCSTAETPWQGNNSSNTSNASTINLSTNGSSTARNASSHQTSVVNGNYKFTSHKPILPKTNGDHEGSPKKPPKFFKSRRVSSPIASAHETSHKSSTKSYNEEIKRNSPPASIVSDCKNEPPKKKIAKERKESAPQVNQMDFLKLLQSGMQAAVAGLSSSTNTGKQTGPDLNYNEGSKGIQSSRVPSYTSQVNEKLSQHLVALNNLATNATDPLNSGLGIAAVAAAAAAAATSNGNGLQIGMMPFITDNFCSLPYLNQRHSIADFSYGYNFPKTGYPITNVTTATVTPVNTSKPKPSGAPPDDDSQILNGLLSKRPSVNDTNKDYDSTLDLSVAKNCSAKSEKLSQEKPSESNPLLLSLLNTKKSKSPEIKPRKAKSPKLNEHTNNTKTEKSKSPLIRQLLEKREEKNISHANSSATTTKESDLSKDRNKNRNEPPVINGNGLNKESTGLVTDTTLTDFCKNLQVSTKPEFKALNAVSTLDSVVQKLCERKFPKMNNDGDSNIKTNDTHTNLDKDKLMCLSAQNNNIETMSSNHNQVTDKVAKPEKTDSSVSAQNNLNGDAGSNKTELSS